MKTGVEISLQDNASAQARQIAAGLNQIVDSADGINSALNPKILEDYNRQLSQIGEKYAQLKNTERNYEQQQMARARQATGLASTAGTAFTQLGTGNVGGAAMTAGGGLSSLASLLGGPAALVAGIGLAGGVATNALANQYEQRAAPAQKIAALTGRFATDMEKNTASLREVMQSTVESVAKYGKTYEEGAAAQQAYIMSGGRNFARSQAAAYSQAYGLDFTRGAAFEGQLARYGQTRGLDWANAVRRSQGLSPAMLQEIMGGIQDIFQTGLSRGVIRTPSQIGRGLEFFGKAGPTWQGGLGAQKVQGLNQALAGASGLQNQSDIFLYRAAAAQGGNMIDIKKRMEAGMTPELFKNLMDEFDRFGYGKNESIMQLSRMFGLSVTDAEKMYNLRGEKAMTGGVSGLPAGMGKTIESQYTGNIEAVKQKVAGQMGGKAFDVRAGLVQGGANLLQNLFSNIGDIKAQKLIVQSEERQQSAQNRVFTEEMFNNMFSSVRGIKGVVPGASKFGQMLDEALKAGVSGADIYGAVGAKYAQFRKGGSEAGIALGAGELKTLQSLLSDLIDATKDTAKAVREDTVVQTDTTNSWEGHGR